MDEPIPTLALFNLTPGAVIAQRYEICERIGSGGMGIVYRVIDRELNDQLVALKLLHPYLAQDEQLFKRFRNEVLIARTLSHPNIVRLHDIGKTKEGVSYISMEYVDGESLRERIERGGGGDPKRKRSPVTFEESAVILYQVLTAVAYAHGKGVVHRDLKPANVLLTRSGEVKLADFGTARIAGMDTSLTQTGQVIGTPDYMSPEQIRGEPLDSACDIYSLGIMAYELATGKRPFSADTSVALAFKHLTEPIPSFASQESGIPEWFEGIVRKATAKAKEERFQSAAEFARILLEHSPEVSRFSAEYLVGTRQYMAVTPPQLLSPSNEELRIESKNSAVSSSETQSSGRSVAPLDNETPFQQGPIQLGEGRVDAVAHREGEETEGWKLDVGAVHPGGDRAEEPKLRTKGRRSHVGALIVGVSLIAALVFLVLRDGRSFSRMGDELFLSPRAKTVARDSGSDGLEFGEPARGVAEQGSGSTTVDDGGEREREELTRELLAAAAGKESVGGGEELTERAVGEAREIAAGGVIETRDYGVASPHDQGAGVLEKSLSSVARNRIQGGDVEVASVGRIPLSTGEVRTESDGKEGAVEPGALVNTNPVLGPAPPEPSRRSPRPRGRIVVERTEGLPLSGPIALRDFVTLRWVGELSGVTAEGGEGWRGVEKRVSVNVLDSRTSRLVSKLSPEMVKTTTDGGVEVRGSLSRLESGASRAGEYRLDLVFDGEVLSSERISVYTVGGGKSVAAAAEHGTGGTVVSLPVAPVTEREGTSRVTVTGPRPPLPSGSGEGVAAARDGVRERDGGAGIGFGFSAESAMRGVEGARTDPGLLPSARKEGEGASVHGSFREGSLPKGGDVIAVQPTVEDVALEYYRGSVSLSTEGGAEQRTLSLDIRISTSQATIAGTGEIEGLGRFQVQGKVFPRGVEILLQNESQAARLTGSRREDGSMRGTISIPSLKIRGSWEARRS